MISQYANSERFKRLVDNLRNAFNNAKTFKDWYDIAFNIKTAKGYGLDVWGAILNQSRHFINKEPGDGSWYAWGNYYTRSETPKIGDKIYNMDKSETGFLVSAVSGNTISYDTYYSITVKNVGNFDIPDETKVFITKDVYGKDLEGLAPGETRIFYYNVNQAIVFGNNMLFDQRIEYLNSSNTNFIQNRELQNLHTINSFNMPRESLYIEINYDPRP